MSSPIPVEEAGKPGGTVRTECDLFDHSDAAAVTHCGPDPILYVYGGEVSWVEIVKMY